MNVSKDAFIEFQMFVLIQKKKTKTFSQYFRKQSQAIHVDGKPFVAIVRRL